jgi:hypothetical protein
VFHVADSILDGIKRICSIDPSYTVFDDQIVMHVNSVFMVLNQLGIGPDSGFMIEDNSVTWDAFVGTDNNLNSVKTYMGLRVRMLFDPPQNSFVINAMNEQIQMFEWRLSTKREGVSWTDPDPTPQPPPQPWWEGF